MKRLGDIVAGALLLVVVTPIILVASIAAAISLRAWPFFSQTRIGRDGEPFTFVKLRTLPRGVPPYASKYELTGVEIPRLCRQLRRFHIDELPQLALVVLGSMSLVGPRPEMPWLVDEFEPRFAQRRAAVRPGFTGLWQVSNRSDRMIYEHPEFDEFYLRHRSFRVDVWILIHSVGMLLPIRREGVAYEDLPDWAIRTGTHPRTASAVLPAGEV